MAEVDKCLKNISPPSHGIVLSKKNNPYKLTNKQLLEITNWIIKTYGLINCGINCQIILRNQNPLYISKIKFGNGPGGHVLVIYVLKLFPFKNCTYIKSK